MEKFDNTIQKAQQTIEPREDFVETTMNRVRETHIRHRRLWRFTIPAAVVGGVAIVLALLIIPGYYRTSPTSSLPSVSQSTTPSATPAGTDNASLQTDLSSLSRSLSQEQDDQSAVDYTVDDSASQIAVPTN